MDVQSSANTCVYDGALAVPSTAPTRTGYTFAGWTVRPEIDFGTIPRNGRSSERWAKGSSACWYDNTGGSASPVGCNTDNTFNELGTEEWKIKYSYGDLYGKNHFINARNY